MPEIFARAESLLLAMFFAAAWGAHLLWASVFFPPVAAEPPKSLFDWLATPYAMRLFGFWRRLVPCLYLLALIAVVEAAIMGLRTRPTLAVAGVCGLLHAAMVFGIFLPINLKLGLDPGGPGPSSLAPQMVETLLRRWGRWNFVRIGVETTGLIAALFAFRAS